MPAACVRSCYKVCDVQGQLIALHASVTSLDVLQSRFVYQSSIELAMQRLAMLSITGPSDATTHTT